MHNVDNVEITVVAGSGGDGAITFRREKFVPFGGPDGGDGGKGGDVYSIADGSMTDLGIFRRKTLFKAEDGGCGRKQKMHGRDGEDLIIRVPVGTVITAVADDGKETVIADLKRRDQKALIARGGKGGKGNVHFATSTNQAPRKATKGKSGERYRLILDLKIIADIGIVGYPSVGKSTLLGAISRANPEVAAYPFTTREPVLGVVTVGDDSFIAAEIPGLIEGAHKGKGLGHKFLRHAERTSGFLFLLDGTSADLSADLTNLRKELTLYSASFSQKPRLIAVNKIDLPEVSSRFHEIETSLRPFHEKVYFVSAVEKKGIAELILALNSMVKHAVAQIQEPETPPVMFHPKPKIKRETEE